MPYAAQLKFGGEFSENIMRFEGEQEAMDAGQFLAARWPFGQPEGVHVVGSDDPVNYRFDGLVLEKI